jgi:LmbE family N-acetylglucosaminyl deacetylase
VIPESKIRALRDRLEADGEVEFSNESKVIREVTVKLVVIRPHGGVWRLEENDHRRAYEIALAGLHPVPQPKGDPAKFGDDPPY